MHFSRSDQLLQYRSYAEQQFIPCIPWKANGLWCHLSNVIFDSFVSDSIFCLLTAFLLFICFEMKDAHEKFKDLHMPITPNGMPSLVLRKKKKKTKWKWHQGAMKESQCSPFDTLISSPGGSYQSPIGCYQTHPSARSNRKRAINVSKSLPCKFECLTRKSRWIATSIQINSSTSISDCKIWGWCCCALACAILHCILKDAPEDNAH